MKKVIFLFLLLFLLCPFFVSAEQIDINSATLSQLDEIVHVGIKTAQKIIDDRPYSSVSDLGRVKGIGDGKYLQDIINQGFACVNCQTEIAQTQQPVQESANANATTTEPIATTNEQAKNTTGPSDAMPLQPPAIIYPGGVFINEILPNPEGPDETDEWIELYNSNNSDVDFSGWQLQDQQGTITTFKIPAGIKILASGFLIFKRPDTKIMLNNDGDGLNLLTPDDKIIDSVSYVKAPLGQSYNKTSSGWAWSTTATPGSANIITTLTVKTSSLNSSF